MDLNQLRKLAGLPPAIITENALPNPSVEREFQKLSEKIEELVEHANKMNAELMDFSAFLDKLSLSFDISEMQKECESAASGLQDAIEVMQMELEHFENSIYGDQ